MDENSIAGRTEKLRREIELIQHQEHRYRRHESMLSGNFESFRSDEIQRFGQRIATGGEWCVPPPVQPSLVGLLAASALCDLLFFTVFRQEKPAP